MMRDAIKTGRMRIDGSELSKSQISRLPVHLNELGQWVVCAKKDMREKHNIKSPDRSDTYCFMFLATPEPILSTKMEAESEREEALSQWIC